MRGLHQGEDFGGSPPAQSHTLVPSPSLRHFCLCFACFKWLSVDPGMGLGSWSPLKPSGGQSWTNVGLRWGKGTGKSSLLSLGTLPAHAWWGPLGDCWGTPEPGLQLPPPHPTLSPACFQLSCTASDFSVLTRQLQGPLGEPSQCGHRVCPSSSCLSRRGRDGRAQRHGSHHPLLGETHAGALRLHPIPSLY